MPKSDWYRKCGDKERGAKKKWSISPLYLHIWQILFGQLIVNGFAWRGDNQLELHYNLTMIEPFIQMSTKKRLISLELSKFFVCLAIFVLSWICCIDCRILTKNSAITFNFIQSTWLLPCLAPKSMPIVTHSLAFRKIINFMDSSRVNKQLMYARNNSIDINKYETGAREREKATNMSVVNVSRFVRILMHKLWCRSLICCYHIYSGGEIVYLKFESKIQSVSRWWDRRVNV